MGSRSAAADSSDRFQCRPHLGHSLFIDLTEDGAQRTLHVADELPAGRHQIHICRAESCQAVGAEALIAHVEQRLGVTFHQTTADGQITLEPIYCLGNCALSPAITIDRRVHGRVSPARFDALLAGLERAP